MDYNLLRDFYSQQHGGMSVFTGTRRQMGGSFLSGLARIALPILKFIGPKLANFAGNVVSDVIAKKPVGESIKRHGLNEVQETISQSPINKRRKVYKPDTLR